MKTKYQKLQFCISLSWGAGDDCWTHENNRHQSTLSPTIGGSWSPEKKQERPLTHWEDCLWPCTAMFIGSFAGVFPGVLLGDSLNVQGACASPGHDEVDRLQVKAPRSYVWFPGFGSKHLRWMAGYQPMPVVPTHDRDWHSSGVAGQSHKVSIYHLRTGWWCNYNWLESTAC